MIIDHAAIKLQSGHYQQQASQRRETLRIWHKQPEPTIEQSDTEHLKLTDAGKAKAPHAHKAELDLGRPVGPMDALVMQIIRRMVKEMTGQELKLFSPEDLQGNVEEVSYQEPTEMPVQSASTGTGLIYQRKLSYFESETTSFNAEGIVTTKDGKNIDFSVSVSMNRSFYKESTLTVRAGDAAKIDPLVVNFDGNAAELSDSFFEFDIDADGSLDQIATLKSNSGMLALDKNQDGVINDGSELFGPRTGNGFEELAAYDEDHNQFIDEADSIYSKLRIWQRHADGSQHLLALGEKNVGAIYLGHVSTPFQLKTEDNASLGDVASSGIYLTEEGTVGTLQQINFTV